jgi:hypothetical protein
MRFRNVFLTSLTATALAASLANPAHATVSITCTDLKFDSSVEIVLGAGPVPNVLSVRIAIGDRELTTEVGFPGEVVSKAQNFDDGEVFRIDLMDQQATRRVAAIRLLRGDHDTMPVQIGFVQIEDDPPVGITCVGP